MLYGKKYDARVLAINVSGINEEEAGALNGHDVPVKNDYTRHRRFIQGPLRGDTIDVLLAYEMGEERRKDSYLQIRSQESRSLAGSSLGARYNFHSRVVVIANRVSRQKTKKAQLPCISKRTN